MKLKSINSLLILLFLHSNSICQLQWVYYPSNSSLSNQYSQGINEVNDTSAFIRSYASIPRIFEWQCLRPDGTFFHDTTGNWNNILSGTDAYKLLTTSDGFVGSFIEDYSTTIVSDIYAKFNTKGQLQWVVSNDSQGEYIDFTILTDTIYTLSTNGIVQCKLYGNSGNLIVCHNIDTSLINSFYKPVGIKVLDDRIFIYGGFYTPSLPGSAKRYFKVIDKNGNVLFSKIDSSSTADRIIDLDVFQDGSFATISELNYQSSSRIVVVSAFNANYQKLWTDTLVSSGIESKALNVYHFGNEILSTVTSNYTEGYIYTHNNLSGTSSILLQEDSLANIDDFKSSRKAGSGNLFISASRYGSVNSTRIYFYSYTGSALLPIFNYVDTLHSRNIILVATDSGFYFGSEKYYGKYRYYSTGVSEISKSIVSLYPNPCQDKLILYSTFDLLEVSIFDISGRIFKIPFNNHTFDTSNLAPGMYTISGIDMKGNRINLRFFKV